MPQTGQMWLEHELLSDPSMPGLFCITTSYRQEPEPEEGRHNLIFPMFEFEMHGEMVDLRELEVALLAHAGFGNENGFVGNSYKLTAAHYHNRLYERHICAVMCGLGLAPTHPRFPSTSQGRRQSAVAWFVS